MYYIARFDANSDMGRCLWDSFSDDLEFVIHKAQDLQARELATDFVVKDFKSDLDIWPMSHLS